MIAQVLIDINIDSLNRLFDYIVPINDEENIKVGMRVIVPFGEQIRLGYVFNITDESLEATKELIEVLDIAPSITEESLLYVEYLKNRNRRNLIDVIKTVLPKELFVKYQQKITILKKENLSDDLLALFGDRDTIVYTNKTLKPFRNEINRLIKNNSLEVTRLFETRAKVKTKQAIKYNVNNKYDKLEKYEDLIGFVSESGNLSKSEIVEEGFSLSSINTLIKYGVFFVEEVIVDRKVSFIDRQFVEEHVLNQEQKNAVRNINLDLNGNNIFLLKGVTGSGKTEVYMQVMKEVLKNKKNILYLVPEVNMVPLLMRQLKSRFSFEITHYNSGLSAGKRLDSWQRIVNDEARIIVGTRSSVFLPIANLGLIVIDEEHDESYIQDQGVTFDATQIAILKSKYHNCPVILGSATPKVNSMYYAKIKEYTLLELKKRINNIEEPKIHLIDMKEELKSGNTSIYSKFLYDRINDRINKKEQTIVLYNRKGYAPFVTCRTCGNTPKCPHCDVNLTYYQDDKTLRCHYCSYKEEYKETCNTCGSNTLRPIGYGLDRVFDVTKKTFKKARVLKIDANSVSRQHSFEKMWLDFQKNEYDILVGTKMISKGLDLPNVTLSAVLMADLELKIPTYLASERAYNILMQTVGRSGRNLKGEAVIQGYDLDNYAIESVTKNYDKFYNEAIYYRKISKYEPFYKVVQIVVTNESFLRAYQDALKIKKQLEMKYEIVLGPVESIIKFVNNQFRFFITIKDQNLNISKKIIEFLNVFNSDSNIDFYDIPSLL
ncbi:MAG: primosomal protein N' [Acholeplasma sp.]|nr:primosomal protein N' [Acholeplasma sp.]